jgi:hypothetical protein
MAKELMKMDSIQQFSDVEGLGALTQICLELSLLFHASRG